MCQLQLNDNVTNEESNTITRSIGSLIVFKYIQKYSRPKIYNILTKIQLFFFKPVTKTFTCEYFNFD